MISEYKGKKPIIHESCFIANNTDIIGEVEINEETNIWFGTRIRGDINSIVIGCKTNVQENSVIHVDNNSPVEIGDNVTIGHGSIIHGCSISNNVLVGMGTIILNDAKIGKNTIIGAGSLVTEGKVIPEGVLCMGRPAKVIRELTEEEKNNIKYWAKEYVDISDNYKVLKESI